MNFFRWEDVITSRHVLYNCSQYSCSDIRTTTSIADNRCFCSKKMHGRYSFAREILPPTVGLLARAMFTTISTE